MKSLYQFAESILLAYYGGRITDDARYTIRQVAIWAMQEREIAVKQDLFAQMKEAESNPSPDFFKSYDKPLAWDSSRQVLYIELPSKVASLPYDKGIGAVYPQGAPEEGFMRMPKNSFSLLSKIHTEGNNLWELSTDRRLEFRNLARTWEEKVLTIDAIPMDEDLDTALDEPLRMSGEFESIVRDRVLALMRNKVVSDTANDNLDQT